MPYFVAKTKGSVKGKDKNGRTVLFGPGQQVPDSALSKERLERLEKAGVVEKASAGPGRPPKQPQAQGQTQQEG